MTHCHNRDQIALAAWLVRGLELPEVRDLAGDAGYILNNMIAKFGLFADRYGLSRGAEDLLRRDGVDRTATQKRARFYGKKSPFIYEHAIPAVVVRAELLARPHLTVREMTDILDYGGQVLMILRTEDRALNDAGLQRRMPDGWSWGDDPLARYSSAGIKLSRQSIAVDGAVKR